MNELTKYIMGVAAKSNVEKRQVGCVITNLRGDIVAEGYNIGEIHAEAMACEVLIAEGKELLEDLTAHVTHPPCPECAKLLANHGVTDVKVVEAFMKFDGDKTRYDLIPAKAWMSLAERLNIYSGDSHNLGHNSMVEALLNYQIHGLCYLNDTLIPLALAPRNGERTKYELIAPEFLEGVAEVLTFGARKYKPNNWRKVDDPGRYLAAAFRHLEAIRKGEEKDSESGLEHWKHFATNIMFLIELEYVPNQDV